MDRRDFLKTSVPALAAMSLGLTGCGDDTTPAAPLPPPEVGAAPFPPITWITKDPSYTDYRPAVDATAQQAVFERTPFPNPTGANTTLYLATSIGSPNPPAKPFLEVPANPAATYPYSQTRPDWSWVNHQVVFSGAPSEKDTIEAHIATANGKTVTLVPKTLAHIYPTWTSDGTQLVIYNNSTSAAPVKPVTSLIMPDGNVVVANLNGTDTANPPADMFGGFAAPKPGTPTQIAFAGAARARELGPARRPDAAGRGHVQPGQQLRVHQLAQGGRRLPVVAVRIGREHDDVRPRVPGPRALLVARRQVHRVRVEPQRRLRALSRTRRRECAVPSRSRIRRTGRNTRNSFRVAPSSSSPRCSSPVRRAPDRAASASSTSRRISADRARLRAPTQVVGGCDAKACTLQKRRPRDPPAAFGLACAGVWTPGSAHAATGTATRS